MNLQDTYKLRYNDADFKGRLTAAVAVFAQSLVSEDPATPNHSNRLNFAQTLLSPGNTEAYVESSYWAVIANPAVQAAGTTSSDADIQVAVNSVLTAQIPPA